MTPQIVAEIRGLMAKATAGPWEAVGNPLTPYAQIVGRPNRASVGKVGSEDDGLLIAALRNHAEALLAAADENAKLRDELIKLRTASAAIEEAKKA